MKNGDSNQLPLKFQQLIHKLQSDEKFTPGLASRALAESGITPADLQPWAQFDHPSGDSYGRKLIYDGGHFELMAMSWAPGDMSMIHDHGYTEWGAVQVFGPAEHAVFKINDNLLRTAKRWDCEYAEVLTVGHDLIHQMGNVGDKPFFTLHLYGCYGREGDVTADAHLYDLHEEVVQLTSGGVFFDLPDKLINDRLPGVAADFPTWLRFQVELLKRLMTKHDSLAMGQLTTDLEKEVAAKLFAPQTWAQLPTYIASLEAVSERTTQQYMDVLHRELRATIQMQTQLLNHDMVANTPLNGQITVLNDLLNLHYYPQDMATQFIELLGKVYQWDKAVAS